MQTSSLRGTLVDRTQISGKQCLKNERTALSSTQSRQRLEVSSLCMIATCQSHQLLPAPQTDQLHCSCSVPDLSVELAQNDGFLKLLRFVVNSAVAFPEADDYYRIPCEAFDYRYRIEKDENQQNLPQGRALRACQAYLLNSTLPFLIGRSLYSSLMCLVCPQHEIRLSPISFWKWSTTGYDRFLHIENSRTQLLTIPL